MVTVVDKPQRQGFNDDSGRSTTPAAAQQRWRRLHDDGGSQTTTAACQQQWWRLHNNGGGSTTTVEAHDGGSFTLIGWWCALN
jgi:hypothetical protein